MVIFGGQDSSTLPRVEARMGTFAFSMQQSIPHHARTHQLALTMPGMSPFNAHSLSIMRDSPKSR
jgi:hypothetical protein